MLKSYYKPTPKNIRKMADAFLLFGLYLTAQPDLLGEKETRYVMIGIGLAKMLSNFFTTESLNDKAAEQ